MKLVLSEIFALERNATVYIIFCKSGHGFVDFKVKYFASVVNSETFVIEKPASSHTKFCKAGRGFRDFKAKYCQSNLSFKRNYFRLKFSFLEYLNLFIQNFAKFNVKCIAREI